MDSSGTLYIADSANNRVRKVAANGNIAIVAGTGAAGYAGDGGNATSAQLRDPEGLAIDSAGNLYIADSGNGCIRKITPGGTISTIAGNGTQGFGGDGGPATAAQMTYPRGVAVDAASNLYIADFGNGRIRKVTAGGTISTVAGNGTSGPTQDGGPATSAALSPQGVAVDTAGNIYIGDFNHIVWKVTQSGTISRIAGTGVFGYSGDGGSAANAQLTDVRSVAVDAGGNVYISDTSNDAVRMLRSVSTLLSITTATLPAASVNAPYSQTLSAAGGAGSLTWLVIGGSLPPGLVLSTSGTISGTPTAVGTGRFTVQVTDAAMSVATMTYSIMVTQPAITTFSPLLQGTVGLSYSQTLSASGGALPYTWTLLSGSLPAGLMLSASGVITGTPTLTGTYNFAVKLTDAALNTATQSFTIVVLAAAPLARSGVLAHIAAGGGWSTTIYLANVSSNQVAVALALHADDGTALTLPMMVTQAAVSQSLTSPSVNAVIGPNSTLVLDTGAQVAALVTGWVDVSTSGPMNGFAIFRNASGDTLSEGTSPLQTQFESGIDVPFDNRNGYVTAVALANLVGTSASITATLFDSTGNLLGTQSIPLAANGHGAFLVPTLVPQSSGVQGIVQFRSSAGNLAGVGLRASPQGTFTSVPIILP
jgi:hypothetical protein